MAVPVRAAEQERGMMKSRDPAAAATCESALLSDVRTPTARRPERSWPCFGVAAQGCSKTSEHSLPETSRHA